MLQDNKSQEIVELRLPIEVRTASLAAIKINSEELHMLKLIIDKMKGTEEGTLSVVLDKEFHHKLAGAAHNILIFNMMNVTSWLVDAY